jgi:hypothetical protein
MDTFTLCIHHQSVRRNFVALWTGRDIPAGIPMSWKASLLRLNNAVLGRPFCFRGSNGHDHLSASSSSLGPLMTTAFALDPT